jgi:hypothetical protein
MIRFRAFFFFLFILPKALFSSENDPMDNSRASTDGPYVFYRGEEVVVKYVVVRDTTAVGITRTYPNKKSAVLTCMVKESGDKFDFSIRESIPQAPTTYPATNKILALSDIEGNFQALKTMLLSAGVMDKNFNWTFGDGHIVLLGDFFDRGLNVTECLWLLYKLDGEADLAGGKVHFILGNHEIMNLQGNTQYVRRKYLENAKLIKEEYKYWYDSNSELGRWLRSKNAIEKIGDYAFCHGGVSPELAQTKLSIEEINRISRQNLGKPDSLITAAEAKIIFDNKVGIFWNRALAKNLLSQEDVNAIFEYLGAKRLVLGHTLQTDITAHYSGRVICIDLYHEENLRQGYIKTLLIENGYCYTIDSNGDKSTVFSVTFPRKTNK